MTLVTYARLIETEAMTLTTAAINGFPRVALESVAALARYVDAAKREAIDAAMADGCDPDEIRSLLGMTDGR